MLACNAWNAVMKHPGVAAVRRARSLRHPSSASRWATSHFLASAQRRTPPRSMGTSASKSATAPAAPAKPTAGPQDNTWMVVGLGNPGPQYNNTRHNVGFMVVDELARQEGVDMRKLECKAAVGKATIQGAKVILAKPITFMNVSGESVGELSRYYKVPAARILVISDDLDLPVATLRLRAKGGHGGHNGLRSIMQHLQGTQDFPRLKIGIGRPQGQLPVAAYVLQPFAKDEKEEVAVAVQDAITAVKSVLKLGVDKAVSGVRI